MPITFKKGDVCCLRYKQKDSDLLFLITADSPVGTDIDGTVLWPTVVLHEDRQFSESGRGASRVVTYAGPYPYLKKGQVVLVPAGKMIVAEKGRKRKF
jgi:hypothetical protein